MKKYTLFLFFIIISQMGTTMTSFSLGIWRLDKVEDSILGFALISFMAIFPQIILGPLLGSIVDRLSKKRVIIGGQLCAAIGSLVLIFLFNSNELTLNKILLVTLFCSIANGLVAKAFYVSAVMLVDKKKLSNAKGMEGTAFSLVTIFIPIIAPIVYHSIGLHGVFLIDVFSFTISIIGFIAVKMNEKSIEKVRINFVKDGRMVMEFFRNERGLLQIIWFYSLVSFLLGALGILLIPLILGFTDESGLGLTMLIAGVGGLAGGAIMSFNKKELVAPMKNILNLLLLIGIVLVMYFFVPINIFSIGILSALFMFFASIMMICDHTFWQNVIPYEKQARVLGYKSFFVGIWAPLAYIVMSLLIDKILLPLIMLMDFDRTQYLATDRALVILFLFSFIGVCLLVVTLIVKKKKKIQKMDLVYASCVKEN